MNNHLLLISDHLSHSQELIIDLQEHECSIKAGEFEHYATDIQNKLQHQRTK